jgi:uncharacterized membrane protein YqhA
MMGKLLERARYLLLITTLCLSVTTVATIGWGVLKTIRIISLMIQTSGQYPDTVVPFIEVIDAFLVATALLIVTVSLYRLAIEEIDLPDWMAARNFEQLKCKLAGLIILVMAVKFLEQFMAWQAPAATLQFGLALAAVAAALIALSRFGGKGEVEQVNGVASSSQRELVLRLYGQPADKFPS